MCFSGAIEVVTGLVAVKRARELEHRLNVGEVKCYKFSNMVHIAVSEP